MERNTTTEVREVARAITSMKVKEKNMRMKEYWCTIFSSIGSSVGRNKYNCRN